MLIRINKRTLKQYFKSIIFLVTIQIISLLSIAPFWDIEIETEIPYLDWIIFISYFILNNFIGLLIGLRIFKKFRIRQFFLVFFLGILAVSSFVWSIGGTIYTELELLIAFCLTNFFLALIEAGLIRAVIYKIKRIKEVIKTGELTSDPYSFKGKTFIFLIKVVRKIASICKDTFLILLSKKELVLSFSLMTREERFRRKMAQQILKEKERIVRQLKNEKRLEIERLEQKKHEEEMEKSRFINRFFRSKYFRKFRELLQNREELISYMELYFGIIYFGLPLIIIINFVNFLSFISSGGFPTDSFLQFSYNFSLWIFLLKNRTKIDREMVKLLLFLPEYQKMGKDKFDKIKMDPKVKLFVYGAMVALLYLCQYLMINKTNLKILTILGGKEISILKEFNTILWTTIRYIILILIILAKPIQIYGKMKTTAKERKRKKTAKEEEIIIDESLRLD